MADNELQTMTESQLRLHKMIEESSALRLQGNERFKQEDYKGALSSYYTVLLNLRGLDHSIGRAFPILQEVKDGRRVTPATDQVDPVKVKEETLQAQCKNIMALTNTNMAACHVKLRNWKKALHFALEALKLDDKNRKAKFREAQARIGLGETQSGRRILEDLDNVESDASIKAAIRALDVAEKAREQKAKDQFKGFLSKQAAARKEADTSTDPTSTVNGSKSHADETAKPTVAA